ncbi:MAG: pentapeptide repeat-containing protein [Phormidesmis sp.]
MSAFQLAMSFAEQRSQRIAERWQTIASGPNAGGAKRQALEYLHDQGELLSNVELLNVQLSRLNLPERLPTGDEQRYLTPAQKNQLRGARLQEADFRGSNLYQGYLQGANLYRSNFSSLDNSQTNLDGVNFQNTDLRQADFRNASVRGACFKGANLEKVDFTGAELRNTDFRGSRFLTKAQIQAAGVGVDSSLFDAPLSDELGLGDLSGKAEPASCRTEPRNVSWWRTLIGR